MKGLKIKDIIITRIATVDPPLLNAAGLHAPYALRTILEGGHPRQHHWDQ